jgi:hypothetical protein
VTQPEHATVEHDAVIEIHPAVLGVLRFFDYHHLPSHLAEISRPFHDLAHGMAAKLPADPEVAVGLRKLREVKDVLVSIAALNAPREGN